MNFDLSTLLAWLKNPGLAAMATSAFSLLFGLHSLDIILASLGAFIGWGVFQSLPQMGSPVFAAFLAALAAGFYSEIAGWIRSRPATVYIIASIIPLVPGGGMYYTMLSTLEGDSMRTVELFMTTLMSAFALAAGLAISNAFGRMVFMAHSHISSRRKAKP
jgi:uncharacterized membrane protein YjjB (DUF3815 family)